MGRAHRLGIIDWLPEIPRPPKGAHRTRFLSEEEIPRLLAACRQSRNRLLAPLVTLALTTGARYSELAMLTWEQLDLEADFGLSPIMRLTVTKSGRPRRRAFAPGWGAHTCGPGPPDRPREPWNARKRRRYGTAYGTIGRSRRLTMRHYRKALEILSF